MEILVIFLISFHLLHDIEIRESLFFSFFFSKKKGIALEEKIEFDSNLVWNISCFESCASGCKN